MSQAIRSYHELQQIKTFEERYAYLRLDGSVGVETFGFDRYLNQLLYSSRRWKKTRDIVLVRDNGCDLGLEDYPIKDRFIIVHHMNPITIDDIRLGRNIIFDPDFLVCTSKNTHLAIHFSNESLLPQLPIERRPGDTCLWRKT